MLSLPIAASSHPYSQRRFPRAICRKLPLVSKGRLCLLSIANDEGLSYLPLLDGVLSDLSLLARSLHALLDQKAGVSAVAPLNDATGVEHVKLVFGDNVLSALSDVLLQLHDCVGRTVPASVIVRVVQILQVVFEQLTVLPSTA